jgi:hypothetical protein
MNCLYEIKINKNRQNGETTISLAKKVNSYSENKVYLQRKCDDLKEVVKRFSHFQSCSVSFIGRGSKTSTSEYNVPEAFFEKGHGWRESFAGKKTMKHFPNTWYEIHSVTFKAFKTIRPVKALLDYFNYTLKAVDKEAVYGVIERSGTWLKQIG